MKIYAYICNGVLIELILGALYEMPPDSQKDSVSPEVWESLVARAGSEIPIGQRFTPEFVGGLMDVSSFDPAPVPGMSFSNGEFSPPPGPTPEEIFADNKAMRDALLASATLSISPLQDASDLDEATPEEAALLKMWKQYRVAVNRIDLTPPSPVWPPQP